MKKFWKMCLATILCGSTIIGIASCGRSNKPAVDYSVVVPSSSTQEDYSTSTLEDVNVILKVLNDVETVDYDETSTTAEILKLAELSSKQIGDLAAYLTGKNDKIVAIRTAINEKQTLSNSQVRDLLTIVKDSLEIVGPDALGKLVYNAIDSLGAIIFDPDVIASLKEIAYKDLIIYSRVLYVAVNDILKVFSREATINDVGQLIRTDDLSDEQIVLAAGIFSDVLEATSFTEADWKQLYLLSIDTIENVLKIIKAANKTEDNDILVAFQKMSDKLKSNASKVAKAITIEIKYYQYLLEELDTETVSILRAVESVSYGADGTDYSINGVLMNKDQFMQEIAKPAIVGIRTSLKAYDRLSNADKKTIIKTLEAELKIIEDFYVNDSDYGNGEAYSYDVSETTTEDVLKVIREISEIDYTNQDGLGVRFEEAYNKLVETLDAYLKYNIPTTYYYNNGKINF